MAATFKNYDPGRFVIVVKGVQIQGYAPGTFIKVARDSDAFKDKSGAGGDIVRTKSRDHRGSFTITLLQTSPSNDYLQTLQTTDEEADSGLGSVGASGVKDLNGTSFAHAENTWVLKPADMERADDAGNVEWVVRAADLEIFNGGSLS